MIDKFCDDIDKANDIDYIERTLRGFRVNRVHEGPPPNFQYAYIARKLALKGIPDKNFKNQIHWQNYWFRCCISEKCNYIFSILKSRNVDREDDLLEICDKDSKLWNEMGNEAMKGYVDKSIDFLLRRYNWIDAYHLCRKYPSKLNLIKLLLPRMSAAILIGFLPIITSKDIRDFAEINQPNIYIPSIILISFIIIYLLFEYHTITHRTLVKKSCSKRVGSIFIISLGTSLVFSYLFTIGGIIGNRDWCWYRGIFYAMFALFIGILAQLLWEEKTAPEPL